MVVSRTKFVPFVILLVLLFAGAFLFYGPFDSFRLLWINTAMYSSHFKWLAASLYSREYIQDVMDGNKPAYNISTDAHTIDVAADGGIYFAPLKGNYFQGFIIKIENPRRISLVAANGVHGQMLEDIVKDHDALGGVNASGYADDKERGRVWGMTIIDGVLVSRCTHGERHVIGGFTDDYKFVVGYFTEEEALRQEYRWAVEFGPLLIVNGEKMDLAKFYGGLAPRTAIGQCADGSVLLVTADGRRLDSIGATYHDIQTVLFANGAMNAMSLDGGSSTTMVYNGAVVNAPSEGDKERLLPNAILFW